MAEPAPPASQGGIRGALRRPIGPLPTWAWVLIVTAIVLGWAMVRGRASRSAAPASGAGQGQVPQFVNQTYTTVQPPEPPEPPDDDKDDRRRHHRPHPTHGGHGHGRPGGVHGAAGGEGRGGGSDTGPPTGWRAFGRPGSTPGTGQEM